MGFRNQRASQAVLIFDWDDTICPSTFIDKFKVDSYHELPGYVSTNRQIVDELEEARDGVDPSRLLCFIPALAIATLSHNDD